MKTYQSKTTNGGTTINLDSIEQAIDVGSGYLDRTIAQYRGGGASLRITPSIIHRDRDPELETTTLAEYRTRLSGRAMVFEKCAHAIRIGDAAMDREIIQNSEALVDLVAEIEPTFEACYAGFGRSEDGIDADVVLLASGSDQPFFRRNDKGPLVTQARRGRAYRTILNTDLGWTGCPEDNAAVVGALVVCLQTFGPVGVWVQQGWLGTQPGDGVTLFKLDFTGGFEPTQLTFWCGHPLRDNTFSFEANMALGRCSGGTSKYAEITADLFLREDWMKMYGITEDLPIRLHTDKVDLITKWIAETAMQIVTSKEHGADDEADFAM